MLRSFVRGSIKIQNSSLGSGVVGINAPISQIVRWKAKKPRWLPVAKSKLFKIDNWPEIPRDELLEMRRLQNYYRTYRKSIKQYFEQLEKANQVEYDEEKIKQFKQKDFERCQKLNDEWNKEIALKREERLQKEWIEKKKFHLEKLAEAKVKEEQELAESEEYIRKLKQEAAKFITREMVDQAIEEALENEVSYNVAIDSKGNKYTDIFDRPGVTVKHKMTN
ncbi:probable 28S ribosomal protein S26, mitochondrial [Chelonus insularis]|uniref:probable 28S ribosomal protein S26, mitochondrial n=1 Tax=Chelonus insularis TaxID=460826 RepID=UPI00158B1C11|nr:probable 28S ribosomal protein S26, mitochondrial [Chelonus insularis]